jgi:hypothetical protein
MRKRFAPRWPAPKRRNKPRRDDRGFAGKYGREHRAPKQKKRSTPIASAASRTASGSKANAPDRVKISLPTTPASNTAAMVRTNTKISEFSSMGRATKTDMKRQISLGRKPKKIRTR